MTTKNDLRGLINYKPKSWFLLVNENLKAIKDGILFLENITVYDSSRERQCSDTWSDTILVISQDSNILLSSTIEQNKPLKKENMFIERSSMLQRSEKMHDRNTFTARDNVRCKFSSDFTWLHLMWYELDPKNGPKRL